MGVVPVFAANMETAKRAKKISFFMVVGVPSCSVAVILVLD